MVSNGGDGRVVGIVCEYNPFHDGHAYMIKGLRSRGAEVIVGVMSGPFVQRAEAACLPVHLRARAALYGGMDLVFRLPVPWALASAEGFGYGAVGLLAALGCVDRVAFGAETADTERLSQVAGVLCSPGFQQALKEKLQEGLAFASARAAAAKAVLPGAAEVLKSPNNILAVEYCKALQRGFPLAEKEEGVTLPRPLALPRLGASHDGQPVQGVASASWLRARAYEQGVKGLSAYVPASCQALYEKAEKEGNWLDPARFETAVLARLKGMGAGQFAGLYGAGEGLENKMVAEIRRAVSLAELYSGVKSKRYAHSRVRRLALTAALGIPAGLPAVPPFLHLVAASRRGLGFLKEVKETTRLPLSTSLAKLAKENREAAIAAALEARAEDLHAFCLKRPGPGGGVFTRPVQIVPGQAE